MSIEKAKAADVKKKNRQTLNGNNYCNKIQSRNDPRRWAKSQDQCVLGRYM